MICDCYQKGHKKCQCGAVVDGVLQDGAAMRVSLFMRDSAHQSDPIRKELHMMTDAEVRSMRDSVRGMPLYEAAKLPIYDNIRGLVTSGMPAERYYAVLDGADASKSIEPTEENIRALGDQLAARQACERDLNNRWRGDPAKPVNDNRASAERLVARDGRSMTALSDRERADEAHRDYVDSLNSWRNS